MLFAAKKEFLPGSFEGAGLLSPSRPKGTPQETFVAQTLWAETLLVRSSVAQLSIGLFRFHFVARSCRPAASEQPYFELRRLAKNQNSFQQRGLYLRDGFC